ncbi:HAD family hydrolase [Pseudodesulfovibrio sediminis]|uniref:Phosphatase n=1 Tax=Pseudodesulfovibrio sediminis TaxID=2810563 RepID=A0ABN6ES89_9BACT|nr:HAD family phosphatase [Pseudodesulfovibrio sediminis]BCS89236.1 phosphatase [Pseudodesulfovibrio sediminis]
MSIAVLFDMDGVIFDSEPIHEKIFIEFARSLGFSITPDVYQRYIGTSSISQWRDMKAMHDLEGTPKELSDAKMERYKAYLAATTGLKPIPGITALLDGLQAEAIPFALASSNNNDVIEATLTSIGLRETFSTYVGGDDVSRAKPDPAIFLLAADRLGVSPDRCVVIEDSTNGVIAAKRAGMRCVGFDNPNSPGQTLVKADLLVTSIHQLTTRRLTELLTT